MKRPNETRMALTGAKRNVETMRAVRRMKISARRSLGAVILTASASLMGVVLLFLSGIPLFTVRESHTQTFQNGSVTSSIVHVHWSVMALLVPGAAGVLLLLIRSREKTKT